MKAMAESVPRELPMLLGLLFPVFFVGLWCGVCFMLSKIGGWGRLAGKFAAKKAPEGKILCGQSGQFSGFINYNRCLTIIISTEGLYLKVWPIFGLGHKPILIPWDEIRNVRRSRFLWMRSASFDAGNPTIACISLSERIFELFPETGIRVKDPDRRP